MRILLVDDDSILRETIRDILTHEGYEVTESVDGMDAMRKLATHQFELVITDVLMPEQGGLQVIKHIKNLGIGLKVLAISGGGYATADSYLRLALDAGADDVISKPFDLDSLLKTIERVVSNTTN